MSTKQATTLRLYHPNTITALRMTLVIPFVSTIAPFRGRRCDPKPE